MHVSSYQTLFMLHFDILLEGLDDHLELSSEKAPTPVIWEKSIIGLTEMSRSRPRRIPTTSISPIKIQGFKNKVGKVYQCDNACKSPLVKLIINKWLQVVIYLHQ